MSQLEGFLVVQAEPNDLSSRNPRYRGIDRTPPFSMAKMEQDFEDPLVFGGVTGEAGLILSAPLAQQVKSQFETIAPRERLEIIVANAGVLKAATIEDMSVADFDHQLAVNVRAPYFLVQQLLPILGSGSSVVLVSSLAGHSTMGINRVSAYAASRSSTSP